MLIHVLFQLYLKIGGYIVTNQCKGQGIGRHTTEEIRELGIKDMKALSDYLGDKPFVMGDKPTVLDCTLFGFMSGFFCAKPADTIYNTVVRKDFPNLERHFNRMKDAYWKDWDDCLYKPEQ